MSKAITPAAIRKKLRLVNDPELNISIVDLGLVYDITVKKEQVIITLTLTTIGCPLFSLIEQEVRTKVKELGIVEKDIRINLSFDPPWSIDRMSPSAKARLGI